MKIGIIGTGHIGKTLVRKLAKTGHSVQMANSKGPESLKEFAEETGARALTPKEAIQGVDVIILSIPMNNLPQMKELLAGVPDEVVVIDTSNYYPFRDNRIDAIEAGQVESQWVTEQLGHPVVKAWNAIGSDSLAKKGMPAGSPNRIALPVAADREEDRKIGMTLVEDTGFDAFDAGTLAESWRQQPGAPCYGTELTIEELPAALAAAERERLPKRRDLVVAAIQERVGDNTTNPDAEYGVRLSRAVFM
jgi:8-hydroxy-5-deazaflavin:NADPH oxidoreductase